MRVITKSATLEDRLGATPAGLWVQPPVLAVLSVLALAGIVATATGHHAAAALMLFVVALAALSLRIHDTGLRPPQEHLRAGLAGEQAVTALLRSLDDRYVLVNGLRFARPPGELDHLLLGPHGLLALETKAHHGHVACLGGDWHRWVLHPDGRREDLPIGNPSAQVARTLGLLRAVLDAWHSRAPLQAAVVFTHPQVELEVHDAPLPVLTLDGLSAFIAALPAGRLAPDEVERLAGLLAASEPALEAPQM